jgi:hypothetical protein
MTIFFQFSNIKKILRIIQNKNVDTTLPLIPELQNIVFSALI